MSLISPFSSPLGAISDVKNSLPPPLLDGKENAEPEVNGKQKRKVTFISPAKPAPGAPLSAIACNIRDNVDGDGDGQQPSADLPPPTTADPWSELRDLDDQEKWVERSIVVTKADHDKYLQYAAEVLEEMITNLPCYEEEKEQFRCATEVFSSNAVSDFELDFLDNVTSGQPMDAALSRQSLYVRFDPLVQKTPQPQAHSITMDMVTEAPTSTGSDLLQLDTPRPKKCPGSRIMAQVPLGSPFQTPTTMALFQAAAQPEGDGPVDLIKQTPLGKLDLNAAATGAHQTPTTTTTANKPMNLLENATPILNHTAPSCTRDVVSSDAPTTTTEETVHEQLQYTEADLQSRISSAVAEAVQKAKEQMANENAIFDFELDRLASENSTLKAQSEERQRLLEEMRQVVSTCNESLAETADQSDVEIADVLNERIKHSNINEQLRHDVESLDNSYIDLFNRFEKLRHTVVALQTSTADARSKEKSARGLLEEAGSKCRLLKESVQEKMKSANASMDKLQKDQASESAVLKANIRKATLHIEGLQRSVSQKDDDNKKLTSICDEMMTQMQQVVR